ncbi:MAG: alpha/beta hydrolase [Parvularculaceae bacterium]|nr:alpha/beta hydrolase [Parvularculaceae bacterium]
MKFDVDPKTKMLLDMIEATRKPLSETTVEEFRAIRVQSRALMDVDVPTPALIKDFTVAGDQGDIGARLYDDTTDMIDDVPRPTLVYFHGGGFVFGDLDSHDALCRRIAVAGDLRVIAIDYRLAPEHPFPAAVNDAWAAFNDVLNRAGDLGVDLSRIAVGGDSAGANLAIVTARRAAAEHLSAPQFQLLFYPVTQSVETTPSREKYSDGLFLTKESMDWFDAHYVKNDADRCDERLSPLLYDVPENLAPALVVTAALDPLVDEGRAYAGKLRAAGVQCDYVEYPRQVHGFVSFTAFSELAIDAIEASAKSVRRALDPYTSL